MNIDEFKRILVSFADEPADVDVRAGRIVAQVRDDMIDIELRYSNDEDQVLRVSEGDQDYSARTWIVNRVARLPQLADRILSLTSAQKDVAATAPFVVPRGMMSPDLGSGETDDVEIDDAVVALLSKASVPKPGATSVLYITSDAGEGKTTIINRAARIQAERFKRREARSLIVPIPLNGRAFLTFDDAVIASLVNRLRFNYLYFEAFLQLIKLGVVVPAFDGYEEMLVEGSKGDAVSPLGNLVQSLGSSGTILVAARKAFFEYQSFKTQARLLDAIGNREAEFSRLALQRWSRSQFCEYGRLRGARAPEDIYDSVATRLPPTHPLLTRAVLVRRLYDVAESADYRPLTELLAANPQDFFFTFVDAIVKREADEKWLVRVMGDDRERLLSQDEHHELLAQLALEMWHSSTTVLRYDMLDLIVDLFCEGRGKSAAVTRQVGERLKQHSLLATDAARGHGVVFDHEDFQNFYLGEGVGKVLSQLAVSDIRAVLSVNILPAATIEQVVLHLIRKRSDLSHVLGQLEIISRGEAAFSFCKENSGAIVIRLVECLEVSDQIVLSDLFFPVGALGGRALRNVVFNECYFQPTTVQSTKLDHVTFKKCVFERIELGDGRQRLAGAVFEGCRTDSLVRGIDDSVFDPILIDDELRNEGAAIEQRLMSKAVDLVQQDEELRLFERFLRLFARRTHTDEEGIRVRLGHSLGLFSDNVLPRLLASGVLEEVGWRGQGVQKRYRLAKPMAIVSEALEASKGNFDSFLEIVRS